MLTLLIDWPQWWMKDWTTLGKTGIQDGAEVVVERAAKADVRGVIDLVVGLAEFERLKPPDKSAKARLVRDIFDKKLVSVFVARVGKRLAGYALYFYTYSSFIARPALFLEDIFVRGEYRGKGVGEALFVKCAAEAYRHGCGRMKWEVLTWNRKAMRFYEKLGAEMDDLRLFRLEEKSLRRLGKPDLA